MGTDQTKTPLIDALKNFDKISPAYFCIPSHHRGKGASSSFTEVFGKTVLKYDLTETPLTDDLHEADGAIKEAESLASELFGSDRTFFLVNGTTCANEAMIISSVCEGEKILVARNCHKSVLMGLIISGASPVYIEPEISGVFSAFGSISPEKVKLAFKNHPDIKAFILTSPTYYGIGSDLQKIADICHSHGALLLVDEAHGSHFAFSDKLPKTALSCGADMVSQSTHKTLNSMTQSSMLHVKGSLVDISKVDAALKIVQSTSPSYILMASLDAARQNAALNGRTAVCRMLDIASYIRSALSSIDGVSCPENVDGNEVFSFDKTRIVFSVKGISGFYLSEILFEKYNICCEMADNYNVVSIIGSSDSYEDADRLINAVKEIAATVNSGKIKEFSLPPMPPMAMTPRKAFFAKSTRTNFKDSVGKVSAEMIAPYPPGIPVIYPGEFITEEIYEFISEAIKDGRHIHGFSDKSMETIKII
ncbi:MAG: aminotransferase class I/II-fold pyridoxal phosphate-dependent enzyme [Clostridiales bacterium]|nr:aminotransferase class I/II-fold pyridoxal phosphate-dependent enzyme [Clostridiales bacterium]